MFIQKCKNCSKKFKWSTIIKATWDFYSPIECDNCKTKHYVRFSSRIIIAILLPLPLLFTNISYSISSSYSIFIDIMWFLLVIFLSPFLTRYFTK
jgi:CXXC-20-CXXC protein